MNHILVVLAVGGWIGVFLLFVFSCWLNEAWYRRCCEQNEDWACICKNIIAEMTKNDAEEKEVTK